jgi:hypothetical protein
LFFVKVYFFFQGINSESFYKAFDEVMGKSIMFIVKKVSHEPDFIDNAIEVLRVSDDPTLIEYFAVRGVFNVPSKVRHHVKGSFFRFCLCHIKIINL